MNRASDVFEHVLSAARSGNIRPRGARNVECRCPKCGRDWKFAVNVFTGKHACFICDDMDGSIFREIQRERVSWGPVARIVVGRSGVAHEKGLALARDGLSLPLWTAEAIPIALTRGCKGSPFPSLVERARQYTLGRGFTPDTIRRYRVSVVPMQNRVYLPVWEPDGRITYYMGRALDDGVTPKTLEPGTEKPLFGLHVEPFPEHIRGTPIVLVEGAFDHIATPRSFGLMGSYMSQTQLQTIKRLAPSSVLVIMDPDAKRKALKIAETLIFHRIPAGVVVLPGSSDPSARGAVLMERTVHRLADEAMDRLRVWTIQSPLGGRQQAEPVPF